MRYIPISLATCVLLLESTAAFACPTCRPLVKAGVYNGDFAPTLLVILLPLVVLAATAFGLYYSDIILAKLRANLERRKVSETWQIISNAVR